MGGGGGNECLCTCGIMIPQPQRMHSWDFFFLEHILTADILQLFPHACISCFPTTFIKNPAEWITSPNPNKLFIQGCIVHCAIVQAQIYSLILMQSIHRPCLCAVFNCLGIYASDQKLEPDE